MKIAKRLINRPQVALAHLRKASTNHELTLIGTIASTAPTGRLAPRGSNVTLKSTVS